LSFTTSKKSSRVTEKSIRDLKGSNSDLDLRLRTESQLFWGELMSLNIIGLSSHYHDSACCLLRDGKLVAAAQEERFSRKKHDPSVPSQAVRYCLDQSGLTIADIDCVAYYEHPVKKLARQLWMMPELPKNADVAIRLTPRRVENDIRETIGYQKPIEFVDHHTSHAASSYFFSGFSESAIMTVDGVGEWATTTYGSGNAAELNIFSQIDFPDSLGLLYSALTSFLGFSVNDGEYKVMGLAPYGSPNYVKEMYSLIEMPVEGHYRLNLKYFNFASSECMYSGAMQELFKHKPRSRNEEITSFHRDVARSLQFVLEEVLLEMSRYLHRQVSSVNLCMAGGVALNCVANTRILRDGPFRHLFVQPAAGDAGGCLGAALVTHLKLHENGWSASPMTHAFWGPEYSSEDIAADIKAMQISAIDFRGDETALLKATAARLADGKVIGWFHGRMEFGPRSLGARSILADPRDPKMRDRINSLVKKREEFRPFAPAVLESMAGEHFDLNHSMPFMLETCQVNSRLSLPAITHVDGSARVQTVNKESNGRFAMLLQEFYEQTGCPMLLNTSFNMKDEPIVCTPADALVCFIRAQIDTLVLEDFLIDRAMLGIACQVMFQGVRLQNDTVSSRVYTLL
jgi:carbamoyltransferase